MILTDTLHAVWGDALGAMRLAKTAPVSDCVSPVAESMLFPDSLFWLPDYWLDAVHRLDEHGHIEEGTYYGAFGMIVYEEGRSYVVLTNGTRVEIIHS